MSHPTQASTCNSLLKALSAEDYRLLARHLDRVRLNKGHVLSEPNEPVRHICFPEAAIGSVIAISPDGHSIEASIIGCEGLSSLAAVHDDRQSPHRTVIQVEGNALRIGAEALQAAMDLSPSLAKLLQRYAQAIYVQTTYTALSNSHHGIEERLARWLLMCHDRSDGDEMPLTHEFLALMLDVRRPSVTTALHVLEGMHFIRTNRGRVIIRDRPGLEDFARDAYGIPEAEYARLVGPMPKAEALAAAARSREANQRQINRMERGLEE
jgi:CRP-like cAMP-binding protein